MSTSIYMKRMVFILLIVSCPLHAEGVALYSVDGEQQYNSVDESTGKGRYIKTNKDPQLEGEEISTNSSSSSWFSFGSSSGGNSKKFPKKVGGSSGRAWSGHFHGKRDSPYIKRGCPYKK